MGIPLIRGRLFDETDGADRPVVAVTESAAEAYWPGEDPVGQRVASDGDSWATIVGVVGDVRQYGLDRAAPEAAYVPVAQSPFRVMNRVLAVVVRENVGAIR